MRRIGALRNAIGAKPFWTSYDERNEELTCVMGIYSKEYYNRYKSFDYSRLSSFIVKNLNKAFGTGVSWKATVTIDIGCGTGGLIYKLEDYSKKLIGLDISLDALGIAKNSGSAAFFIAADSLRLPIKDNVCDLCLCIHVIEHIEKFELLLKEMFRIMTVSGKVVFITPNRKWTRFGLPFLKDASHVREFTREELRVLISDYFYITNIRSFSMFTSLGIFNPALNSLIKPDICVFAIKK